MGSLSYHNAKYPVRPDFAESHTRFWEKLAAPGNWFTGAQRVAIAKEVRQATRCQLCSQRKAALSPYAVDGAHDTVTDLSSTVIDVIHRVITDPGRLTKDWFDGIIAQGLTPEEYVEVAGVTINVFTVDEFCKALGVPLNELPEPLPGDPSYYRPEIANHDDGAWVAMLPDIVDEGPEADVWPWKGPADGNVIRSLSLVPDNTRTLTDQMPIHYMELNDMMDPGGSPKGTLTRMQIEVIATRVAGLNGCFY